MRLALLYKPSLLCERLAELSSDRQRLARLRGTVASRLTTGHIDSLELLELLRPLDLKVIFDIGANVGTWTLLAKALFPYSDVHAFEPLHVHHQAFYRNTGRLSGVHLHKLALGEAAGIAAMRVTDLSDASSMLRLSQAGEQQWHIHEVAQERVQVERLDDCQRKAGLPFPSLLKLDVQGFELSVLRGSVCCLEHTSAVLAEVSFREFYQGQCLFQDAVRFLAEREFTLYALGWGTPMGRPLAQADVLFVANRLRGRLTD
jgi:FkbM family methyltransferase